MSTHLVHSSVNSTIVHSLPLYFEPEKRDVPMWYIRGEIPGKDPSVVYAAAANWCKGGVNNAIGICIHVQVCMRSSHCMTKVN